MINQQSLKALIISSEPEIANTLLQAIKDGPYPFDIDIIDSWEVYINIEAKEAYQLVLVYLRETSSNNIWHLEEITKPNISPVVVFTDPENADEAMNIVRTGVIDCVLTRPGYLKALPMILLKAFEVNKTFERIHKLDAQLKLSLEELEEELILSRQIQKSMIPAVLPEIPGIRLSSIYVPSRKIGGDLFNVFQLDEDRVIFHILDVSGHGVPAALISAMAKISFQAQLRNLDSLTNVMFRVNQEIMNTTPPEYYLTSFMAVMNLKTRMLFYTNASHTPPILFNSKNRTLTDLRTNGLFVGLVKNNEYEEKSIQLEPGDKFFLFTDGIYEIFDSDMNQYGRQRLKDFILKHIDYEGKVLLNELIKDQDKFLKNKSRDDDITGLAVELTK